MNELEPGQSLHGFTVVSVTDLPEYRGTGIRLQHAATGLDLFHLQNDDDENFFAFIFKTPPRNNNGTAHILEHAVLAGSRRYPVKDPFLELMKGSAQTFLNAMTYPDKTVYPAASPLRRDYYNLMSVYGDAVFFPLLRREVFRQEGIRVVRGPKGHLSYDGIVFNEMRGAYSDHDSITAERSHRVLFPDTPYGLDSGGSPPEIVGLSYEEFRGFHAEYYHPSNCRIFLYGSIATGEQLQFLEQNFLGGFTAVRTDAAIVAPRPWKEPARFSFTSPGLEEGEGEQLGSVVLNWIAGSAADPADIMTLEILVETLLGNPGALLYRTVIESGLGMDIASLSGMESDLREMVFSVGIKGIRAEHAAAFEQTVMKTLTDLLRDGIPVGDLHSAIRRLEFQHRELRGGVPLGLRAMSRSLRGWLHGTDPIATLRFNEVMDEVKQLIAGNPGYLERFLSERLVKNTHRALVSVMPDPQHIARQNQRIDKSAAELESRSGKQELRHITEENRRLEAYYAAEDTQADRECIPRLSLDDMPRQVSRIESSAVELTPDGTEYGQPGEARGAAVPAFRHDFFTNGIVYVDGAFDVSGLTADEQRLLPLFSRLLTMTGLPGMSHQETARQIAAKTGGFYTYLDTGTPAGTAAEGTPELSSRLPLEQLFFRCKMLEEETGPALELIGSILTRAVLDDLSRIREIIHEQISDFSSEIIPSGSAFAGLRAGSRLREAMAVEELWRGIGQMTYIQSLHQAKEADLASAADKLASIRKKVLARNRIVCSLTADAAFQPALSAEMARFLAMLPEAAEPGIPSQLSRSGAESGALPMETYVTASDVAFNAIALPAPAVAEPGHSAYTMLAHILSTNQLWEKIRVRGGAYGAHAEANLLEGLFTLSSYRDPRIAATYADFTAALESIAGGSVSPYQLEQAAVALISRDLRPMKPRELGMLGFRRNLYHIDDELRQRRRDDLFSLKPEQLAEAADCLLKSMSEGQISAVTIAGKGMVDAEHGKLPGAGNQVKVLVLQPRSAEENGNGNSDQ